MTNLEIVCKLAPVFYLRVQEPDFLDPFEDFAIPYELIPISAEVAQQWKDDDDQNKRLAIKFAQFAADILAPAVE